MTMACFGSKGMQSRRPRTDNSMENPQMGVEESGSRRDGKKKNRNRRAAKEHHRSRGSFDKKGRKEESSLRNRDSSIQQKSVIRKQVDPEMTKYFTEIANLLEGTEMDLEERSAICGNALEETMGKESEVATDYILSHTLQNLLEGCDVHCLCGFLQRCADNFPYIAMDRSGSHVVETTLKSLSLHANEGFAFVEETFTKICQVVVANALDLMCSCYGSHVLRSLLCVCKGVPMDALEEFHTTKKSATLVRRLSTNASQSSGNISQEYIQSYAASISSLESGYVLESAKNAGGARVIESFLFSGISAKQKYKLIAKFRLASQSCLNF
ncbi:hypothetical protein Sjap_000749 [Stephania japonica]|uniref:Uncharacterized protein n=1 Tax=Stephania japonica TaxID=461633 RepID=A0AAP0KKY6_9MAGN